MLILYGYFRYFATQRRINSTNEHHGIVRVDYSTKSSPENYCTWHKNKITTYGLWNTPRPGIAGILIEKKAWR